MTDHLALAKDYIAKGDDFYARAAEEIAAEMEERPELTWAQVGRDLERDKDWVRRLVTSFRNRSPESEGFKVDWERGSHATRAEIEAGASKLLETADDDKLTEIVDALPPERRDAIGRAVQRDGAQEAVDNSLDVQVARMFTQVAKVDVLLREGRTFNRLDHAKADRLGKDLDHLAGIVVRLREAVEANSTIRRVA